MRYGTLPIVARNGRPKDTVLPYNEYTSEGTGFSFAPYNAQDLLRVIDYAHSVFRDRTAWQALLPPRYARGAFLGRCPAKKYLDIYQKLAFYGGTHMLTEKQQENI